VKALKEPMTFVQGWRFLTIGALLYLWIAHEAKTGSYLLILLLLVLASLRWRFGRLPVWTAFADAAVCLAFVPFSDIGVYGLALPIFEFALKGKWAVSLLFFAGLLVPSLPSSLLFWLYVQAFLFGAFACTALGHQRDYKREADEQRKARQELERIRLELLEANRAVSRQAELMERHRISRQLHDHLGHDLTGASLALQAYEYVSDPAEARELLREVGNRLERSTTRLREAVHNMTPVTPIGADSLAYIARNFRHAGIADIRFRQSGDMQRVAPHMWELLEACLKEALTNIVRHSNASEAEVELQASETIVRLRIGDNGTVHPGDLSGSGIRGLQMRARALGGSLSRGWDNGFTLVCVLPLEQGGGIDETADSRR
jgi:Signal transduction histidine kinase